MGRRDAYLAVWGICYMALGGLATLAYLDIDRAALVHLVWAPLFLASGGVAVAAGFARWPLFQSSAFFGLTGAATLRGLYHVGAVFLEDPSDWANSVVAAVVWLSVAGGKYVVAGWPTQPPMRRETYRGDGGGDADWAR